MATADDSINFQFTAQGQQLATQALAGNTKLDFTKAVASTDNHFSDDAATIAALTTLGNVKQTATITEVETVTNDDTEVRIPVTFDKSQVGDDYQLLSVGLYCKPDDGDEVLYAVAGLANPILMHQSVAGSVYSIALYVLVGTAENVTIKVDPAGSITQADLTAILAEYVKSADIKTVAYTDKPNTFAQQQTFSAGAVDGAGHKYVTEDKVPKPDLSGLQPKGDYATNTDLTALKNTVNSTSTGLPSKASATDLAEALQPYAKTVDVNQQLDKKVNASDMRKPANDVAGIEEVNVKADDSKVVHTTDMRKAPSDVVGLEDITTVYNQGGIADGTDVQSITKEGLYQLNGSSLINFIDSGKWWGTIQVINQGGAILQIARVAQGDIYTNSYAGSPTHWSGWNKLADDSKVAHLSGANNFDTVPTVNNSPLLLASSLPSDLARTGSNQEFTGKNTFDTAPIDKTTGNPYITKDGVPAVPSTLADTTKDANFTGKLQRNGKDVATTDDLTIVYADVQKLIDTAVATATTTLKKYADDAKQGAIDQIQPMITAEFTKRNAPSSWWNGDATAYAAITPKVATAEYDVTES